MTLDEAIQKHKEWTKASPRPGGLRPVFQRQSLLRRPVLRRPEGVDIARARRQERLKAEAEQRRQAAELAKKEREQERKDRELAEEERRAQREQLMLIQEELRRQHEKRAHENGRP